MATTTQRWTDTNTESILRTFYCWFVEEPTVGELFSAARDGDSDAWNQLVDRLAPAVWAACWRLGLGHDMAMEVYQVTWLRLVEHRNKIREPDAVPGWVRKTARNEAIKISKAANRTLPSDIDTTIEDQRHGPEDLAVLAAQRELVLRGFAALDERCQQILRMLNTVPKVPYEQIALNLNIAVGSIGPTRQRCLEKLRATDAIAELVAGRR